MKLASLKSTSRDGILCVVNRQLTKAVCVPQIASTMQYALDNWSTIEPQLQKIYRLLNEDLVSDAFSFDAQHCTAPLPRAYQWADGSAYVNHVELVRKARGAELPANFWTDPLMYQGCSDSFIGPTDPILVADEAYGIDFESELAIITDDVPMGVSDKKAAQHIKLFVLVNDVSLRNLIPDELAKGFGFSNQNQPAASLR